jgi:hypothetical protein
MNSFAGDVVISPTQNASGDRGLTVCWTPPADAVWAQIDRPRKCPTLLLVSGINLDRDRLLTLCFGQANDLDER